MCDPTTIAVASFGLNAAGTIASYKAQQGEAAAARASATNSLKLNYQALGARELEEVQAATQEKANISRAAATAQGSAQAGAAASGVSGVSVDLLLGDLEREGGEARDSVQQNLESSIAQLERQKLGARANAQSQINGSPSPSFIPSALRLASAGLETYSDLRLRQPPRT